MATPGPKPASAAIKRAKGTGRRPVADDQLPPDDVNAAAEGAVPVETVRVKPPEWLRKGKGLEIWNRLAPGVIAMKLLTQLDAETFARYCRNFALWLQMQQKLDKEGAVYWTESAHGKLRRAHPAFLIGDRLDRALQTAEANFGLNPAERQRIMAARAAGGLGDLFGDRQPQQPNKGGGAPAPVPPPAAPRSPVGVLQ